MLPIVDRSISSSGTENEIWNDSVSTFHANYVHTNNDLSGYYIYIAVILLKSAWNESLNHKQLTVSDG